MGTVKQIERLKITALTLKHGECIPINGYILDKDNKVLSYACDTSFCKNYNKMCSKSNYMFSDVTGLKTIYMHMGLEDYKELYKKYPKCKFYAIHRADYETEGINDVEFPNDGEVLEI